MKQALHSSIKSRVEESHFFFFLFFFIQKNVQSKMNVPQLVPQGQAFVKAARYLNFLHYWFYNKADGSP